MLHFLSKIWKYVGTVSLSACVADDSLVWSCAVVETRCDLEQFVILRKMCNERDWGSCGEIIMNVDSGFVCVSTLVSLVCLAFINNSITHGKIFSPDHAPQPQIIFGLKLKALQCCVSELCFFCFLFQTTVWASEIEIATFSIRTSWNVTVEIDVRIRIININNNHKFVPKKHISRLFWKPVNDEYFVILVYCIDLVLVRTSERKSLFSKKISSFC